MLDFVHNFASFVYVKVDMCDAYQVFDNKMSSACVNL